MTVRVSWQPMPKEYKVATEKYVAKYIHLVPSWCHTLQFSLAQNNDTDGAVAATSVEQEYRQAFIMFFPSLLDETEVDREKTVAHELLHIALAPLVDYARRLAVRAGVDEADKAERDDEITHHLEGAVCDLTRAVVRAKP